MWENIRLELINAIPLNMYCLGVFKSLHIVKDNMQENVT